MSTDVDNKSYLFSFLVEAVSEMSTDVDKS